MVHPDFDYQEIEQAKEKRWIIAKNLIELMTKLERGFTIKDI